MMNKIKGFGGGIKDMKKFMKAFDDPEILIELLLAKPLKIKVTLDLEIFKARDGKIYIQINSFEMPEAKVEGKETIEIKEKEQDAQV